jgi:hypothetical protein
MTGVSKIRNGGGLTALVEFARNLNTGGTGVVGTVVTFGITLAETLSPVLALSKVAAKTMAGMARRRMHTIKMINRNPEVVSRILRMEFPFFCSINIVMIALKYGCSPDFVWVNEKIQNPGKTR